MITLLTICSLSHGQAHRDIAMVAVVFLIVALIDLTAVGTAFGSS